MAPLFHFLVTKDNPEKKYMYRENIVYVKVIQREQGIFIRYFRAT
jgi:hypothetical protein